MRFRIEIGQRIAHARADNGVVLDDVAVQIFDDDVEHLGATVARRLKLRAVEVNFAVDGDFHRFNVHERESKEREGNRKLFFVFF